MINQIKKYAVQSPHVAAFKAALSENKKSAEQETGCVEMKLFVDNATPTLFFTYERWEDQTAFNNYSKKPCAKNVAKLANTMLDKPVEVMELGETSPSPAHDLKKANPEDDVFIIFFAFKFKDGYRERLLERFKTHIENTREEEGNILFDLYTINGVDDTLLVYEHWRNESAVWNIHFKQPYSELTGALMHDSVVGDMEQYMNFVTEIA